MNKQRYTVELVIEAIRRARGMKTHAAHMLGCTSRTLDRYCNRYPAVQEALDEAREALLDDAESALATLIEERNWPAIRFVLSTRGKDRGYTTRAEITMHTNTSDSDATEFIERMYKVYGENAV